MANEVTVQKTKQEVASSEATRPGRTYVPNVDIWETDDALWLRADMPGVAENSVDVRLDNHQLQIEGRVSLSEYDTLTPIYTEYNVGHFERTFRLSDLIDEERIEARMNNGVLELQLPKAERARPRRIEISAA